MGQQAQRTILYLRCQSRNLYPVTDVIDTYVYRALRVTGDIGMSATAGLYQSVMGLILILLTNSLVKRARPESALL